MKTNKIKSLKVIPAIDNNAQHCWALKDGNRVIAYFVNKLSADAKKMYLEKKVEENFSISSAVDFTLELNSILK